jgi:hypothetical protein
LKCENFFLVVDQGTFYVAGCVSYQIPLDSGYGNEYTSNPRKEREKELFVCRIIGT